jgi:hypothetical protein
MNKFLAWYRENHFQLSWFIVGFLVSNACYELSHGQYFEALFSLGIAYLNYHMVKQDV